MILSLGFNSTSNVWRQLWHLNVHVPVSIEDYKNYSHHCTRGQASFTIPVDSRISFDIYPSVGTKMSWIELNETEKRVLIILAIFILTTIGIAATFWFHSLP